MRRLWMLGLLIWPLFSIAQDIPEKTGDEKINQSMQEAYATFQSGKYLSTRQRLDELAADLESRQINDKTLRGLVAYWRGVTANRQIEYADAIKFFQEAITLDYRPKDIYYEYGQALYASEKLPEARQSFGESVRRSYKRAVSLYYIGFISQTLGDNKKAVTFYRAIEKLPPEEKADTYQAAMMQVADIYLSQAEKHPDALKAVEKYVIPQFKEALAIDPDSNLAPSIRAKITGLEQKYELVLYRMRNGRPTPIPAYFLRLAQDITLDTNPVFAATETTNSEAKQSSLVSRTDAFGRYTFFHKNIMSFSPELRTSYTRHLKRKAAIYRNDNWVMMPALRTAYEHTVSKKQASFIADADYSYSQRDRDAEEEMKFNARVTTVSVGERIVGLIGIGETTFRARHRIFDSFSNSSDSTTNGVSFEHVLPRAGGQLYIFNVGYDMTKVNDDTFDTNTTFMRADVILPEWKWRITPQFGFGVTLTDPVNNSARGLEKTLNPSMRLSKQLVKRWRLNFHADYMQNDSDDRANYAYKKTFYGFELEYVF